MAGRLAREFKNPAKRPPAYLSKMSILGHFKHTFGRELINVLFMLFSGLPFINQGATNPRIIIIPVSGLIFLLEKRQ